MDEKKKEGTAGLQAMQPSFVSDEEWALIGKQVEASMDGEKWVAGTLVEVIDLFVPYRVLLANSEIRTFSTIREPSATLVESAEPVLRDGATAQAVDGEHPAVPAGPGPQREATAGAVARGWCHPSNASKVMDSDLALAITEEVSAIWPQATGQSGSAASGEQKDSKILAPVGAVVPAPQTAATNIAEMVNRFLGWKLPADFSPDCGISFKRESDYEHPQFGRTKYEPIGTNLFSADQAKAMFEFCLAGSVSALPDAPTDEPSKREALIACLGDDAATLMCTNLDDEMAQTMREAAVMLEADGELQAFFDELQAKYDAQNNEFHLTALQLQQAEERLAAPPAAGVDAPTLTEAQFSIAGRFMADRSADECGVDRADNWKIYGDAFIAEFRDAYETAIATKTNAPTQTGDAE